MVAAWEYQGGDAKNATLHKEELKYEFIKIAARNYK
jgi:succinate dehydrogenase / fumarate reductase flavoprotein subunit